ncbi:hypothetical protein [Ilumatobacter coccineus]|nr:hypothetical protein [Ilumatobacter coccineus]
MNGATEIDGLGAAQVDIQTLDEHVPLGKQISGLQHLSGRIRESAIPTSCRLAVSTNAPSWEQLRAVTPREVFDWRGVGSRRATQILMFAAAPHGDEELAAADDVRLGDTYPSLQELSGLIDPPLLPSLCRRAVQKYAPTWEELCDSTPASISNWQGVGTQKVSVLLDFVSDMSSASSDVSTDEDSSEFARAASVVAAWALANGVRTGMGAASELARRPDAPLEVASAVDFLDYVDLAVLTSSELRSRFDPIEAARLLVGQFTGREEDILERLLAKGVRRVPTLAELGERHAVTGEAIRRMESRIKERLDSALRTPAFESVTAHARTLREELGTAFPARVAPPEFQPVAEGDLVDELFAYLSGPFVLVDQWFIDESLPGDLDGIVLAAFEQTADGYAAPLDALLDELESMGLSRTSAESLTMEAPKFRVLGSHVVRWRFLEDKIGGVLAATGRPHSVTELVDAIGADSERSVRNHLHESSYTKRLGKDRWGLANSDGEEYRSIVEHMLDELSGGSQEIGRLAHSLHEAYGVSMNSINMYATMHPAFIADGGVVRVRPEDDPYVPDVSLELTGGCYVIDGVWAWSTVVDSDLLRGSGRAIPEAFAVHLGVSPGREGSMMTGDRPTRFGWSMRPYIGSLKWVADEHRLVEGDRLLVRRATPSTLDVRVVRSAALVGRGPEAQLRQLAGQSETNSSLEQWLGAALGLGGASMPSRQQVVGRLEARGEQELLDLIAQIDAEERARFWST